MGKRIRGRSSAFRLVPGNGTRSRLDNTNKCSSRGRSSVWLERLPVTQEVASSSLVGPAKQKSPLRGDFCFTELAIIFSPRSPAYARTPSIVAPHKDSVPRISIHCARCTLAILRKGSSGIDYASQFARRGPMQILPGGMQIVHFGMRQGRKFIQNLSF